MGFITELLLFLPHPLGVLLLCILAGFLGWFLPYIVLIWYEYKRPRAALLSGLFCFLVVAQFGEDIVQSNKRNEFVGKYMAELKQDKIFSAMFSHIPASESTMRETLESQYKTLRAMHDDERHDEFAFIKHEVLQGYFAEFLQSMGNEDLHTYLKLSFPQIYALKKKPQLCVKYFLGTPDKAFTQQDEEWMDREEAMKYAVMVKAMRQPHFKEPFSREQMIVGLVNTYREIKWNEAELEKSDSLMSLPPEEGCNIALHMFEAFLHMEPDMGARTYRFIMLEGNNYYRTKAGGE